MPAAGLLLRSPCLQRWLARVFPGLRGWPPGDWPRLLKKAEGTAFDAFERLGIVAAMAVTAWLLRPLPAPDESALPLAFLSQMLLAVPLLLLLAGPFFVRRIRRALAGEAAVLRNTGRGQQRKRS